MELAPTNWLAVIAGTAIYILIGAFWYSPQLFGRVWMSQTGLTQETFRNPTLAYILAIINAFIAVFILSQFIHKIRADTAYEGAFIAFLAWLGFVVTTHFSGVIWESRPFRLFFVHIGCMLISMLAAGVLLTVWK